MANIRMILFVAFAVINIMCSARGIDVGRLNIRVSNLDRRTGFLEEDVKAIWATVLTPDIVGQDYGNKTRTEDLGNTNSSNFNAENHERVNTIQNIKSEVEDFVFTARDGLKREKQWQRETVRNLKEMFGDFQTDITKESIAVKAQLIERLDTESASTDEKYEAIRREIETSKTDPNERMREMSKEHEQLNKILENLSTNQNTLETENQALKQTVIDLQTELTKKQDTLTCDEGWSSYNGHCYLVVEESKTWDDASAYCENINSYLIEITTDAELEFTAEVLVTRDYGTDDFWIGVRLNGTIVYQHSKEQVPQNYWCKGEPTNYDGNEECVVMSRFCGDLNFFDKGCTYSRWFVCETSQTALNERMSEISTLKTENQALKQTVIDLQTELTKKQDGLTCDEGWSSYNGHCYLVVEESKTRDDASAYCENINSYLIEITTDAELEFTAEVLVTRDYEKYYDEFWIGARLNHGSYKYKHSKQRVPETFWCKGEPTTNYDGNCVVMSRFCGDLKVFEKHCRSSVGERLFVCEKA